MANSEFPRRYDVIVLGTGLVESLVAAALARNGRQVLHLDRNDYYGGAAAVHSLEAIRRWTADRRAGLCRIKLTSSDEECSSSSHVSMNLADESIANVEEVIGTENLSATVPAAAAAAIAADERTPSKPSIEGVFAEGSRGLAASLSAFEKADHCGTAAEAATASATGTADVSKNLLRAGPDVVAVGDGSCTATFHGNAGSATTASASGSMPSAGHWTLDRLLAHSRQFNLDLSPKVLYCNGDMIQLLVSSSVSRYCEFQAVTRILSLVTGSSSKEAGAAGDGALPQHLELVPCGRSDVFNSRSLSLVEKRMLTKLLMDSSLQAPTEPMADAATVAGSKDAPEGTYYDFLLKKGCSAHLIHLLLGSVAMVPPSSSAKEALASTRRFLASTGRYGATPFLWPMYGGELSQAFCRMCAVFGGTYVLGRTAQFLVVDNNNSYCSIVCNEGVRLQSRCLVVDSSYVPRRMLAPGKALGRTSRAILITDRSILPAPDGDEVSILALPASACGIEDASAAPTVLLELPSRTAACPKGLYVVHLTCASRLETARQDLEVIVSKLFSFGNADQGRCLGAVASLPRVLWALFFNQQDFTDHSGCDRSEAGRCHSGGAQSYCGQCCQLPGNVYVCDGLGPEFDYDAAVLRAKALFEKLCPGEDFLPPPQDDSGPFADAEGDDGSTGAGQAAEQTLPPAADDSGRLPPVQPGSTDDRDDAGAAAPTAAAVQQQQLNS